MSSRCLKKRNTIYCNLVLITVITLVMVLTKFSGISPVLLHLERRQNLQPPPPLPPREQGGGGGEEGEDIAEWVTHLCPHYRHHISHLRLKWEPPAERGIFFTDTSCSNSFSGRQACAVEAAARHHPNTSVTLYVTAPSVNHSQPLLQVLMKMKNVRLVWLDLEQVFSEEPLKQWHQNREWLYNDERAAIFISDATRSELLRRYGGTYIDLDAITMRQFPSDLDNYMGRLDKYTIAGGVMSFRKNHPLLQKVVMELPHVFDPYSCCTIGPHLLTRCLKILCPGNLTSELTPASYSADITKHEVCTDITVLPIGVFYPIPYSVGVNERFRMFRTGLDLGRAFMNESEAYSLHLYNSLTKTDRIILGKDSIIEEVAKNNCPAVYTILRGTINFM